MKWTKTDLRDLDLLKDLLNECESINSSNNIVPRLTRIERMARRLNHARFTGQNGFFRRLQKDAESAWAEKRSKKEKRRK
jgi:hypothetical protein